LFPKQDQKEELDSNRKNKKKNKFRKF